MKALLAIIATLFVVGVYCDSPAPGPLYQSNITASNVTGLEVILLDGPSWATKIQPSWLTDEFFVFGDKTLRTIKSGRSINEFYAEPDQDPLSYPLIDLHTFYYNDTYGNLIKFTLGVSDYNTDQDIKFSEVAGPYLPLYSAVLNTTSGVYSSQNIQSNIDPGVNDQFTGFMMYSIHCDYSLINSTNPTVIAYFAGFFLNTTSFSFGVIRTYFTLPLKSGINSVKYTFNPDVDVFPIYDNKYTSFSETFKPTIHGLYNQGPSGTTILVVIDPNTKFVYSVDTSTRAVTSVDLRSHEPNLVYDLVSSAYDPFSQQLVIGLATSGFQPGLLFFFDFNNGAYPFVFPDPIGGGPIMLPNNYSNPKAIAMDNQAIYIGLNGYSEILRYNISTGAYGYQRLPEFLHRSWDATVTWHHVYFVTYEQNSKVFRVSKEDFCSSPCPYWGYCQKGKCACYDGFELNKDKSQCVLIAAEKEIIYHKEYRTAHGGEVALGILFALTFIAAAAGWYLWWKGRRGAYQAV